MQRVTLPGLPQNSTKSSSIELSSRTQVSRVSTSAIRWREDYESAERRPIQSASFGSGKNRIFVTSSLHGSDEETVRVLDATLLALSASNANLTDRTILAVRSPNPDGLSDRTLTNSRGVDLNRNWPSTRVPANASALFGTSPASEPETRALIQLMARFQPTRTIHIIAGGSVRGALISNCEVQAIEPFDRVRMDQAAVASLEEYASTTLNSDIVTVILPASRASSVDPAAVRQIAALLTDQVPVFATPPALQPLPNSSAQGPVTLDSSTVVSENSDRPDGAKGYVQLLPPPPALKARTVGDGGRYFELPPPPG